MAALKAEAQIKDDTIERMTTEAKNQKAQLEAGIQQWKKYAKSKEIELARERSVGTRPPDFMRQMRHKADLERRLAVAKATNRKFKKYVEKVEEAKRLSSDRLSCVKASGHSRKEIRGSVLLSQPRSGVFALSRCIGRGATV